MSRITASGGGVEYQFERFTASGTWTKPDDITWVLVSVVGGGAGGQSSGSYGGGGGGHIVRRFAAPGLPDSVSVTVGAGGAADSDGGTSKFGDLAVATGGLEIGPGGGIFDPNTAYPDEAVSGGNDSLPAGGGLPSHDNEMAGGGIWTGGGSSRSSYRSGSSVYGAGGGGTSDYAPGNHSGVIGRSNGPDNGAGPDAVTDLGAGGGGSSGGHAGGVPGGGGGAGGGEGGRGEVRVWSW